MLHAVMMAGGSGTRFWPLSRQAFPKQFLTLEGARSLLQATADRCIPLAPADRLWVVTGADQATETRRQLPRLPPEHLLVEPCPRNTAPCVALAAVRVLAEDPDALMLVLPADHVISDLNAFEASVRKATALVEADRNRLVLFGVVPRFPATGFGYIERGAALDGENAYAVASFREKPDRATADQYVGSGRFYWNCGIFVWSAQRILELLQDFEPDLAAAAIEIGAAIGTDAYAAAIETGFPKMRSISIDFAVLERARSIVVLEAPFAWDDVGGWEASARLDSPDENGNTLQGLTCSLDTRRCIITTTDDHLVATLGLEDCVVVHTPDATLVAKRGDENAMRSLVEELKRRGLERFL